MKEEYRVLNEVEIDFSQYEEESVDELEKKRMMDRFRKSNKKKIRIDNKKVAAVAVALLIVANLGIHGDNVLAEVKSFRNNISSWFGDLLGTESFKDNYSVEIGETIKESDIKVTLNEFFTDNDRIVINLEINKEIQALSDETNDLIPDIYVDGQKFDIDTRYVGHRIDKIKEKEAGDRTRVILETQVKGLNLDKKENIKLVFSTLAKKYGIAEGKFSYDFIYDINNYMKDCKVVDVNKRINVEGNNLEVDKVIISPDRVRILGNSQGFTPWECNENIKYHYDIVDQNNEPVPLKEAIGEGAYFYKVNNEITILKIIPYTFEATDTKLTEKDEQGRTKYIMEDNTITINLK